MTRMNLNSCPRCNGAVLDYVQPTEDSTMCIMCGWLDRTVSESVLTEVKHHLGKSFTGHSYTHTAKLPVASRRRAVGNARESFELR